MNEQKRTRRTKEQMQADRSQSDRTRTTEREGRQEIRQKTSKPLKLSVEGVQSALQDQLGKKIKLKWVRHQAIDWHESVGWEMVPTTLKSKMNRYTPDGRLKPKSESIQDAEAGAYTAQVGKDEYNFLMYKDLEAYLAEDAEWNKEEAARPMDSIQNSEAMGERAGLGGDVGSYQPKQKVKIEKQRDAY